MPRYIDLAGGLGVLYVGRGNPEVLDAVNVPVDVYVVPDVAATTRALAAGRPPADGDPVVSAAALAMLDGSTRTELVERSRARARGVWERLRPLEDAFGMVGAVRWLGPMVDLELVVDERTMEPNEPATAAVVERCYEDGVLVLQAGTNHNVVRLLAPPVISNADLHEGLDVLTDVLERVNKGMPAP